MDKGENHRFQSRIKKSETENVCQENNGHSLGSVNSSFAEIRDNKEHNGFNTSPSPCPTNYSSNSTSSTFSTENNNTSRLKMSAKPEQTTLFKPNDNGNDATSSHEMGDNKGKVFTNSTRNSDESIFEVKMRKNRPSVNSLSNNINNKRQNNDSLKRSSFLSSSTLSLHKTFFPTGTNRKSSTNDSISMSLSRGRGDDGDDVRITGYLEKRSKLLGWKKYWFVLDGRLLAYYKSKAEYDSLSVCCGSINLGIATAVRPIQIKGCKGYPIQIVTRSQVYYLRSPDKQILEQWLIAIQEAASSQMPVWADSGSPFFRYSFAASSQWSLNTSTDDITDEGLDKLPSNLYLNKPGTNYLHKQLNNLQKCHSFASLQSPSLYFSPVMSYKDKLNNNSSIKKKNKASLEAEDAPTSKQCALKEELTRKLSEGKTGESETVKPSLTKKKKSKSELPFLRAPEGDSSLHYYDEIVDFESTYENYDSNSKSTRSSASSNSKGSLESEKVLESEYDIPEGGGPIITDAGIYESVDSVDGNQNEKSKESNSQEMRLSGSGSNRKSGQSTKSEGNKKISSSIDFEGCELEKQFSNSNPNTMTNRLGQTNNASFQSESRSTSFSSDQRKLSMDSGTSNSISSSKENLADGKSKKKSSKAFGGFFHKIFHRDKGKKSKKDKVANQNPNNSLVITGPIDLRGLHKDSQVNRPTNLSLDEARKNSLTRKQASPGESIKSADHAPVIDELKLKVERINHNIHNHALPLTPIADHILSKVSQEEEETVQISDPEKATKNSKPKVPKKPKQKLFSGESIINPSSDATDGKQPITAVTPSEENDTLLTEPVIHRRKNSEDFQQKLAKFNRLSERLSSTFVAALSPPPADVTSTFGRSKSFKYQKPTSFADESIPPLPPKKKGNGANDQRVYYDYPTNNRPVPKKKPTIINKNTENPQNDKQILTKSKDEENDANNETIPVTTFIRALVKKNSAPDIIFSNSTSEESFESNSKEDEVNNVFEEILSPPPIPPKVNKSDASESIINSTDENTTTDYQIPSSIPLQSVDSEFESSNELSNTNIVEDSSNAPVYVNCENGNEKVLCQYANCTTEEDIIEESEPMPQNIYQNLKFATVNTIVQEFETVEETEEEIAEMYDDFPTEYSSISGGGSHTYESISPLPPSEKDESSSSSVRHSGIDQLQMFLNSECHNNEHPEEETSSSSLSEKDSGFEDFANKPLPATPSAIRAGAVSRLGHSSAIDQLKRIVGSSANV